MKVSRSTGEGSVINRFESGEVGQKYPHWGHKARLKSDKRGNKEKDSRTAKFKTRRGAERVRGGVLKKESSKNHYKKRGS